MVWCYFELLIIIMLPKTCFQIHQSLDKSIMIPPPTRLTSLQRYLKQLSKSGELADAVYNNIRPKHAKIARAHGLPKVHKALL